MYKNILFLCTGNSCRSQMAEAFCRSKWGDFLHVYSAGTDIKPMDEKAIKVMREIGIDMSGQHSKKLDELQDIVFDYVVTVCDSAQETCPTVFDQSRKIHVSFQDPPQLAKNINSEEEKMIVYRKVRDEIGLFISELQFHLLDDDQSFR